MWHTREFCRGDARGYDQVWASAVPGRVQKVPGWPAGEALLKLFEIAEAYDPATDAEVLVTVHLVRGAHDCVRMEPPQGSQELYYTEPVRQPRIAEPGIWYEHAADCSCGAAGSRRMPEGEHTYRPKQDVEPLLGWL